MDRVQFNANLENCMVVHGWDVVRLDDAEGARVAALSQPEQAAALAKWVGDEQPPGVVVRHFTPLSELKRGGLHERPKPPSLSLTASAPHLTQAAGTPARNGPPDIREIAAGDATTLTPPGTAVIVVKMRAIAPKQNWFRLALITDGAGPDAHPQIVAATVASPTKLFWRPGTVMEKTFVLQVPAGRWRLMPVVADFCLGGPAFNVAAGEAVFAGTFGIDPADMYAPEMDVDHVAGELADKALAARLTPAKWENGDTYRCGMLKAPFIYAYEMKTASHIGGMARPGATY
jgi:hypothetical protein